VTLLLLLLAGGAAVLLGPREGLQEPPQERALAEADLLPVAEFLPPERRRVWLEPERFTLEPVRDPLEGRGGERDIRESLEEVAGTAGSTLAGGRRVRVRVRPGDTLIAIARRELGDARRWREIAALNRLADPGRLQAGSVLLLPGGPGTADGGGEERAEGEAPVAAARPREHRVAPGETLGAIAARYYGSSRLAGWLAGVNGIQDPGRLPAGRTLRLPPPPAGEAVAPERGDAAAGEAPGERYHVVRPGESLGAISQRVYGTVRYWRRIAEANGIEDPASLRAGQRLRIPPRP